MYIPPLFNFRFNILKQCYFLNKKKKKYFKKRSIDKGIHIYANRKVSRKARKRKEQRYFHFSRLPSDMSLKVGTDAGGSLKLSSARDIAAVYCMKYRGIPYFATA